MTSPRFNQRQTDAQAEMAAFDTLPASIRAAMNECNTSARASVIQEALFRGVSIEEIIEIIRNPRSLP